MAEQLDHQHCFDLIFDVLAGNVVLLYHEFLLFVLESDLVVSLAFVVVQKTIAFRIQLFPLLDQNVFDQTAQSYLFEVLAKKHCFCLCKFISEV